LCDGSITLVAAPPIILPLMIFSGFFINTDSIPVYLDWIKYISPIKYAFQAYCLNEFQSLALSPPAPSLPCMCAVPVAGRATGGH